MRFRVSAVIRHDIGHARGNYTRGTSHLRSTRKLGKAVIVNGAGRRESPRRSLPGCHGFVLPFSLSLGSGLGSRYSIGCNFGSKQFVWRLKFQVLFVPRYNIAGRRDMWLERSAGHQAMDSKNGPQSATKRKGRLGVMIRISVAPSLRLRGSGRVTHGWNAVLDGGGFGTGNAPHCSCVCRLGAITFRGFSCLRNGAAEIRIWVVESASMVDYQERQRVGQISRRRGKRVSRKSNSVRMAALGTLP